MIRTNNNFRVKLNPLQSRGLAQLLLQCYIDTDESEEQHCITNFFKQNFDAIKGHAGSSGNKQEIYSFHYSEAASLLKRLQEINCGKLIDLANELIEKFDIYLNNSTHQAQIMLADMIRKQQKAIN